MRKDGGREEMRPLELIALAREARERAYAPYSGFRVGAALLTKAGRVYTGCNIENAAFTPTNCAERTAFFEAVSRGEREFVAIAIVGGRGRQAAGFCPPCGVCLQVMREFCPPDFRLYLAGGDDTYQEWTLADLLPQGFGPDRL